MLPKGAWVDRPEHLEVRDPQDGQVIDTVPHASATDMGQTIEAAVIGAAIARALPTHQPMQVLRQAAEAVQREHEDFARTLAREGIKTIREARREVTRCIDTLHPSAEAARHLAGATIAFDQMPGSEQRQGYYRREPVGVIGAITLLTIP